MWAKLKFQSNSKNSIRNFMKKKKKSLKSETEINTFLDRAEAWKLSDKKIELCEKKIIQSDLYSPMKGIVNNKSPSDHGLTKEFYKTFWYEIINLFYKSIKKCSKKKN